MSWMVAEIIKAHQGDARTLFGRWQQQSIAREMAKTLRVRQRGELLRKVTGLLRPVRASEPQPVCCGQCCSSPAG